MIAVDAEKIDALIGDGKDVQTITIEGDSVAALVNQLKDDSHLHSAGKVLFELIIAPDYEFPFTELALLSDYLVTLPSDPEIIWGCHRATKQSQNLELNILIRS
ncbi:MAG: hypothetical protein K2N28_07035 [Muribaculaceae bacterium]|nr:hypothetical protein [Muribaculaceae bacterium]